MQYPDCQKEVRVCETIKNHLLCQKETQLGIDSCGKPLMALSREMHIVNFSSTIPDAPFLLRDKVIIILEVGAVFLAQRTNSLSKPFVFRLHIWGLNPW